MSARAFAADATQARTDASSKGRGAGSGGIRREEVVVRRARGRGPRPPRRVDTPAKKGAKRSAFPPLTIEEAVAGVKAGALAKFTETVDIAVRLGVDPKRSDMIVRGAANLPHGTGKKVRVCVFAEGEHADEARAAGADVIGGDELIAEIKSGGRGRHRFRQSRGAPVRHAQARRHREVLGPRGMMPNPKVGTLTTDIAAAVRAMKAGRVEFRAEKNAIVHACVGKTDFDDDKLAENVAHFMAVIMDLRPRG